MQYRQDRDAVSDNQWLQQYQYQQERDRISDSQWQQQFNESRRQWEAQLAWEQSKFAQEMAQKRAAAAAKETSSSGGPVDVYTEYNTIRANGASTRESDSYLREAISAGLISEREATELRDSRPSNDALRWYRKKG